MGKGIHFAAITLCKQLFYMVNVEPFVSVFSVWTEFDNKSTHQNEAPNKRFVFTMVCFLLRCSLRKVKMDQRKLNDNANTLVDMAKVSMR